ncbi:thiopurine S-methyltransferase [Bacterioplanoides sp.]|uniref:thiopurine S-methyltransferase n=1 Tax=Bacterioplanoides sp. TaxID=2066072 RepID=UPI003B00A426
MRSEFWHERWENQQTGFHLPEVNPVLIRYWPDMKLTPGQRVMVPLCGKTLDIIWLLQQGYAVVGIELSEIALDELADTITNTLKLEIHKTRNGDRVLYRADNLLLIAGDFFALSSQDIGPVDAVYDRAALIALPEPMRADYVPHLLALTQQAKQLLVGLSYPQDEMSGPPFSVRPQQVQQYYQDVYQISVKEQQDILEQEPRFKARGLTSFVQDVYLLTPR